MRHQSASLLGSSSRSKSTGPSKARRAEENNRTPHPASQKRTTPTACLCFGWHCRSYSCRTVAPSRNQSQSTSPATCRKVGDVVPYSPGPECRYLTALTQFNPRADVQCTQRTRADSLVGEAFHRAKVEPARNGPDHPSHAPRRGRPASNRTEGIYDRRHMSFPAPAPPQSSPRILSK